MSLGGYVCKKLLFFGQRTLESKLTLYNLLKYSHTSVYCFQHVTVKHLKVCIFGLWTAVVILVSLPLFGFGLYWGPCNTCKRYKDAETAKDIAYAYLYFSFGKLKL